MVMGGSMAKGEGVLGRQVLIVGWMHGSATWGMDEFEKLGIRKHKSLLSDDVSAVLPYFLDLQFLCIAMASASYVSSYRSMNMHAPRKRGPVIFVKSSHIARKMVRDNRREKAEMPLERSYQA